MVHILLISSTYGKHLWYIPVSHLLVPVHCSSFHHALERGWYMSLFAFENLPHKSHYSQTNRSIRCNYHRLLRKYGRVLTNSAVKLYNKLLCSLLCSIHSKLTKKILALTMQDTMTGNTSMCKFCWKCMSSFSLF